MGIIQREAFDKFEVTDARCPTKYQDNVFLRRQKVYRDITAWRVPHSIGQVLHSNYDRNIRQTHDKLRKNWPLNGRKTQKQKLPWSVIQYIGIIHEALDKISKKKFPINNISTKLTLTKTNKGHKNDPWYARMISRIFMARRPKKCRGHKQWSAHKNPDNSRMKPCKHVDIIYRETRRKVHK
jgi:hypothetical protein